MDFPLTVPADLRAAVPPGSSVLLGVSGGVDSSVALALLAHLGCDVHCVTFKNFCTAKGEFGGDDNRSCCSLDAIDDARRLAARFGVRHWVSGVEDLFHEQVIDPFVQSYLDGLTPNPCVNCNTTVRFPQLAQRADELGVDLIATGHYARTQRTANEVRLLRGIDTEKDQSYFLHGLDQTLLRRCVFPLGGYEKTQIRVAAAELGIAAASRPDSQEICFVPDDDRTFLFAGRGGDTPGDIMDSSGRVLGRHQGLIRYTVGQRRGLGIAAPEPLYVLALRLGENALIVGPRSELDVTHIVCDAFLRTSPSFPERGPDDTAHPEIEAQIRYRHRGVPVTRWDSRDGRLEIDLTGPAQAVAPGQFLVLYDGERVVGGARIVSAN